MGRQSKRRILFDKALGFPRAFFFGKKIGELSGSVETNASLCQEKSFRGRILEIL
jgi:hypothetical protein